MKYTKDNFLSVLANLPKEHVDYILSQKVTDICFELAENFNIPQSQRQAWGRIVGLYLANHIAKGSLTEVFSEMLEIDVEIAKNYSDAVINAFASDRDLDQKQKPSATIVQKINSETHIPSHSLDSEIMSHFGANTKKNESTEKPEITVAPPPQPERLKEEHPSVSTFTYNPHTISRFGSVMPEGFIKKPPPTEEGNDVVPPFKPAPSPQPESSVPVKKPETQPVLEVEKANEKSADSYHGQDPYREPAI